MAEHSSLLPPELEAALRAPVPMGESERARRLDAIMGAVRSEPAPVAATHAAPTWLARLRQRHRRDLPPTISHWRRRGVLGSAGALAVAAMLTMWVGVTSLTDVFSRSATVIARAEVIGDTVIPRLVPHVVPRAAHTALPSGGSLSAAVGSGNADAATHRRALSDTLYEAMYDTLYDTIYDTMRIVRFALRAPSASRVALVHSAVATGRVDHAGTDQRIGVVRDLASGLWELRTVVPRDALARSYAFVVNETDRIPVRAASWTTTSAPSPVATPRDRSSTDRPSTDTSF